MSEGISAKTICTHKLVAALAADPTALVADPRAPVAFDNTEEAPEVALPTTPEAPLEAADAAEVAALCAPVAA
jgi:hypothetical protein